MAHAGKLYPVLFRRDWNLNIETNRQGWANRYIFTPLDETTGFGTLIRGRRFDCGPATNSFVSLMTWTSQVEHIGIFDFQIALHADIIPGKSAYSVTFDIIEQHVGVIATVRRGTGPLLQPGFQQRLFDDTIYWDPHWYDSYPSLEHSRCGPKLWADGPPH